MRQITGPDPDGVGPLTAPVTTYSYDSNGNLLSVTDPNGNATATARDGTTSYSYDRANRLTGIDYSDTTPDVVFGYDNVGNRASMSDGSGAVSYGYDNLGRLTSVARGTNSFSYVYDLADNITSRTYPDSTQVGYAYDEDNRLASVTTGGTTTSYQYDPASHLTQTTLPSGNGYVETRSYDLAGRLYEVKNAKGSATLSDFLSTLDAVGNPTQIVQTGAVSGTQTYSYDSNDRLLSVCFQAGTCPGASDPFIRWTYDKVGNRLTEARPAAATAYTYDGLDELTQAGSTKYAYDQNGNEKSAGSTTFTYDLANRLKILTSGSTTTTYSYDGDGSRLQASSGSQASKKTNSLWDTSFGLPQLVLERDGNNALLRRYINGTSRISMFTGGGSFYYHYDALGSVRNLTSSTGVAQWTDTYEPYGAIRSETKNSNKAPANFMKFAGEYNDPTGLYYLRARQYDTLTGHFLQLDPVDADQYLPYGSSYAYSADRPTVMVDPSGARFHRILAYQSSINLVSSPAATALEAGATPVCAATGGVEIWPGKEAGIAIAEGSHAIICTEKVDAIHVIGKLEQAYHKEPLILDTGRKTCRQTKECETDTDSEVPCSGNYPCYPHVPVIALTIGFWSENGTTRFVTPFSAATAAAEPNPKPSPKPDPDPKPNPKPSPHGTGGLCNIGTFIVPCPKGH